MANFITDLYRLAEFCEYGSLRDEMIRDRLVVGLRNDKLSEKLQMHELRFNLWAGCSTGQLKVKMLKKNNKE